MNKYQEAFYNVSMGDSFPGAKEQFEKGLEVLRELVEKETPRKPIEIKYKLFYGWACPHCAHDISNNRKRKHQKVQYCPNCGQKLDWGEEDD